MNVNKAIKGGPRGRRKIRHVGVSDLAQELGLSVPHVSMVLSGKRKSKRVEKAARESGLIVRVESGGSE